jgi:hypothetical protein
MLSALFTLFAISAVAGLVVVLFAARRAPVGFEDAEGFHEIPQRPTADSMLAVPVRVS